MSGEATSENAAFGVHEWNKNRSYTEKIKYPLFLKIVYFPDAPSMGDYIYCKLLSLHHNLQWTVCVNGMISFSEI